MSQLQQVSAGLLLVALAFLAGWFVRDRFGSSGSTGREVLYWVDPMNPTFRSPEPGIAPCGMPLEPVYAGQESARLSGGDSRTIAVPGDRRQLVGIVVEIIGEVRIVALNLLGEQIDIGNVQGSAVVKVAGQSSFTKR